MLLARLYYSFLFSLLFNPMLLFGSQSGLVWDPNSQTVNGLGNSNTINLTFLGKNISDKVIKIQSVIGDCSCLKIFSYKDLVYPNEDVQLFVEIGVRDGGGQNNHSLLVITSEGGNDYETELKVSVNLPELFNLSNRKIVWDLGQTNSVFSILSIPKNSGVQFVSAELIVQDPKSFILDVVEGYTDKGQNIDFKITPGFPSTLHPTKLGALGYVGIKLRKDGNVMRDLIELVNWPIPAP